MSKAAIAFLAGLGEGYLTQNDKQAKQKRDDEDRALRNEASQLQIDASKKQVADQRAIAQAGAPTQVNGNAATLGISGKPTLYEDAGVAGSDFRQARNMAEMTGAGFDQPAPVASFSAGGKAYDSQAGAQAGADAYNAPDATGKRVIAAMSGIDPLKAVGLQRDMTQGKVAELQLRTAEDAQKHDAAFREVTENFTRQGWAAVPKIYESYNDGKTAKVVEDGKGGAIVNVFDKDGRQVGQKAFASEMDFITSAVARLDPKLWVSMKDKQADKAQAQANADRSFGLQVNADKRADRAETRADRADARAGAAASRANANPGLRKIEETETILGRKLTQPERERLAGFGKEDDKGDIAFATDIVKEAVKGGTITPEGASAARQDLFNQIKGGRQLEKVRGGLAAAKAEGKMAEAVQELRARGMTDEAIASIGGEIPKAEKPAPKNVAQTLPAMPVARPQPPSGLTPQAEAAGLELDRARTAYQQAAAAKAPGLAAGRQAIDAHAAKVAQLKAQVQDAQRTFETVVGTQRPAFAKQGI